MLIQPRLAAPLASSGYDTVYLKCLRKLARPSSSGRRPFSTNLTRRNATLSARPPSVFTKEYFWPNSLLQTSRQGATQATSEAAGHNGSRSASEIETLPHRRRRRKQQDPNDPKDPSNSEVIPPDASSRLTTASTAAPPSSLRRRFALFLSLSKPRLTFLIVLTTAAPYCIYPTPDLLSPATTAAPSLSALTLLFLTTGTALSSASANTFNMLFEPKYDAQMSRTRNRPLVRKLISKRAAAIFGILTGIAGVGALYYGVNPTTSFLGAANIVLYAGTYTPMKRISVVNTWVGALVGAIPPLMGWTAAAGQYASAGDGWRELLFTQQAAGGWWLAALLFAWQFPHFNALSHTIRHEYAAAGYKMLCSVNPARNARVALRYSFLMFPICFGLAASGVVGGGTATAPTTLLWTAGSSAINGWMSWQAVRFWWHGGRKGTARGLFWASVWHLPILLVLAMGLKRGIWQRVARSLGFGLEDEEDLEDAETLERPSD
ncbi:mitochondria protoheme IX farnesyltransferase [Rhizodiscina lignyota]|uniref:Protoheme IX farnesyltransferase, mitochondrial n=1 Tax=Rhizodiscina lignyota TaxID=1504668 RepID=A0A9P4IKV7_9PEZI|nr:mitochondria protoheme IX farnesyltransferase [Rhizodiscina lignyota]